MAFLKENSNFPPDNWSYWMDKYNEYGAWYSGDTQEICNYYSYRVKELNNIFWSRLERAERSNAVHLPAAGDIAAMSSNLLFSEIPKFTYDKNNKSGERLIQFFDDNGIYNMLLEGAELSAALSGVFLKLNIDTRLSKLPILSIVTPSQAFPTFLKGRLWECLFYREVREEKQGDIVYRLFENRKKNIDGAALIIEYKLYKGTHEKVGKQVDLNSIEETENLNLKDEVYNKVDGLGVVYVPNMRPNRLCPGSSLGINDFSGCIPLMDSLDLAWTSWVRDIELGMGQILIDEEMLTRTETTLMNGTHQTNLNEFSTFQKCFIKLNYSGQRMGGESIKPFEVVQFEMRTEEHFKNCQTFLKEIINQCGYSTSTFGLDTEGRAESGTALRIRERKSFLTREKKSRYWQMAIKNILIQMQQLDNSVNNIFYEPQIINVELEDSIIVDGKELSETLRNLDQAKAISTEIKVTMQHPDWEDNEIKAETKRILEETGIDKTSDIINLMNTNNNNSEENQNKNSNEI
jgi:A118 family predicted phage portal protein